MSFILNCIYTTETTQVSNISYQKVVHRGVMARTKDKYILMDVTSLSDKLVTGSLIILTMFGILLLFWYQNFGPGIKIAPHNGLKL